MVERVFRISAEANTRLNAALGKVRHDASMSDSDALAALVTDYLS